MSDKDSTRLVHIAFNVAVLAFIIACLSLTLVVIDRHDHTTSRKMILGVQENLEHLRNKVEVHGKDWISHHSNP